MAASFFAEKQGPAILKHGILGRYLYLYCSKTGRNSPENRVVYIDGYAGPGTYDDGTPGSPALAAATARKLSGLRNVEGIYIEQDRESAAILESILARTNHQYQVLSGDLADLLPRVLGDLEEKVPVFAFFDPFGLPVSMAHLEAVMERGDVRAGRRHGPPTEILLNFSYSGLRRTAGHLTSKSEDPTYRKARKTSISRLNDTLGGDWWQEIWKDGDEDRVSEISRRYVTLLQERTSAGWYVVPVSPRLGAAPVYDLIFLTQHSRQGLWHFNECVSKALDDFYEFCTRGELELETEAERHAQWVTTIKANLEELLAERGEFEVFGALREIYGETLGHGREMLLRRAIKELHKEGKTAHDGKGKLEKAVLNIGPALFEES